MATIHRDKWKDQGIGDTIARITKATGIERVVKTVVGEDCGCEERRQLLNQPNILINRIFYPKKQNNV